MTATIRSASMTPESMSLASSEASLTLCSGALRTSIGAGTGFLSDSGKGRPDVVTADGVGDVFQCGDDGAASAGCGVLHEPEGRLDLRAHAAAGELAGGGRAGS